ncbi:MAG: hypothetical protein ACXACI_01940 [Candidatus Hodarchaeales archaeon]
MAKETTSSHPQELLPETIGETQLALYQWILNKLQEHEGRLSTLEEG